MASNTSSTLIRTKLFPPVKRSGLVVRNKLLKTLQSSANKKLILISAPAGFGKTTLLGQWFENLNIAGRGLCWLSLDKKDNDQEIFLRYLVSALQQVDSEIGKEAISYLDNAPTPDISYSLGSLVNDLVKVEQEIFLFLDDFHLIERPEPNEFVELLLDLSPSNFHVVISCRTLPLLPLASMRVRNELVQISADKMRFDAVEAEHLFLGASELEISKEQIDTLCNRCEGWAAGLQLALLSLREADDRSDVIKRYSGNTKEVGDYLADAVLDQQPESIRTFLVGTAVLDRLNGDLCNYILSRNDSEDLLRRLEADNLFIVPLDQERKWYRYHSLFKEFLLKRLNRPQSFDFNELNNKAGEWCKEKGYLSEAIDYMLRADNMEAAAELIEQRAIEEFREGCMPRVAAWINRVPIDVQLQHPRLMLLHGTALYHMNLSDEATRICNQLDRRLGELAIQGGVAGKEQTEWADEIAILRAGISMSMDNASDVIRNSPEDLHSHQEFMEGVINNVKGYSYYALGEFEKAINHIYLARRAHSQIASGFGVMYSDCFLGMLEFSRGNLLRAEQLFGGLSTSDSIVEQSPYVTAVSNVMRCVIQYEMNDTDWSPRLLQSNLRLLEQVGHISLMHLGHISLAKYFAAQGDFELGSKTLEHLLNLYPGSVANLNHRLLVGYHQIKLFLRAGNRTQALRTAAMLDITLDESSLEVSEKWEREVFQEQMIRARLWLAGGQLDSLISLATGLYEQASRIGLGYRAIECLLLLSQAHMKSGNEAEAIRVMKTALDQAAMNKVMRIFIDEGAELVAVIQGVKSEITGGTGLLYQFVSDLLQAFESELASDTTQNKSGELGVGLIESLSTREKDILQLMAEGKSNAVIGESLHISENTVKWHGRNIFSKLGVRNRTEAVITAQDLGLLETS